MNFELLEKLYGCPISDFERSEIKTRLLEFLQIIGETHLEHAARDPAVKKQGIDAVVELLQLEPGSSSMKPKVWRFDSA